MVFKWFQGTHKIILPTTTTGVIGMAVWRGQTPRM